MIKLLKYEFRKTAFPKLLIFAIILIMECVFLYGCLTDQGDTKTLGVILFMMATMFSFLLVGILSLVTLHKDMNTRQGYMLFMTPNSTYKILGAKVAECGLTLLVLGAVGLGLGTLDFSMVEKEIQFVTSILKSFNPDLVPSFSNISAMLFNLLCGLLCSVITAYFADVISSALLNGKKGNLLITFALYILLNYVIRKLMLLIPSSLSIVTLLLLQGVVALILAGIMYVITARLMDRYLSV